jgi:CHAP domain
MPTPLEFLARYRALRVNAVFDDPVARVCREVQYPAQVRKYFMMNWTAGTETHNDYTTVTAGGSRTNTWFQTNKESVRSAAMGKGSPRDYELALEWAVRSGQIATPTAASIQTYADDHLGIDCSGFVTNYLIANGKKADTHAVKRNTGAVSYFSAAHAVNDSTAVRQGDLLVWMTSANAVLSSPGHVAVVESYVAQSRVDGNMRVVEATGAGGANPKLLDSMYSVLRIFDRTPTVPMIFEVRRHGTTSRAAVIRV